MDKIVFYIDTKVYVIEKDNDRYLYNSKVFSEESVSEFIIKLIKMCRSNERKSDHKSNNRIEIDDLDEKIILHGINNQVIKFINSFLN